MFTVKLFYVLGDRRQERGEYLHLVCSLFNFSISNLAKFLHLQLGLSTQSLMMIVVAKVLSSPHLGFSLSGMADLGPSLHQTLSLSAT